MDQLTVLLNLVAALLTLLYVAKLAFFAHEGRGAGAHGSFAGRGRFVEYGFVKRSLLNQSVKKRAVAS